MLLKETSKNARWLIIGKNNFAQAVLRVKIHVVDSLFSDHAVPTRGFFWQEKKGKTGNIREQSFIREHDSLFCHHLVLSSVFVSCYHRLKSFVQFSSLSLCVV